MCGLFGAINKNGLIDLSLAMESLDLLSHRGPDGRGEWHNGNVVLGHRRLSILDLSDTGAQPMISDQCVIAVNGEIYNYKELKRELQVTCHFKSGSDSEVILHGYNTWGLDRLLEKIDGMYAITIFDRIHQKLFLIRDRLGIKPLFYADTKEGFIWSSELKSIVDYLSLGEKDINTESLLDFVTYRYIPSPKTLYRNVYKLPAAHVICFTLSSKKLQQTKYWDLPLRENNDSLEEAIICTESLLEKSIKEQLISDVPVGSFLSGGIDSGLLIALCNKLGYSIPTFSIGFDDQKYDESARIKQTSEYLNIENSLRIINEEETADLFSNMRDWFDEPFADFSTLPTYSVCKYARENVTVALSGDGADELFAGYPRYLLADKMLRNSGDCNITHSMGLLKRFFGWRFSGRLIRLIESKLFLSGWDWYCFSMGGMLPNESALLANRLGIPGDYDRYWLYRKHWRSDLPRGKALRVLEMETSLPEALLTKVDRVSMRCSLEVRVPYLSKELVEYAFSLGDDILVRKGIPKYLLRELGRRYLPAEICTASKKGFGIPPSLRLSRKRRRCSVQYKTLVEEYCFEDLISAIK